MEAMAEAPVQSPWCFDPISDLPGDLAALCLTFVDVRSLLLAAQRVNHAWHHAIDGGLPAVWRGIHLGGTMSGDNRHDPLVENAAQKSHGAIKTLRASLLYSRLSAQGVNHIRTLCNLRVLSLQLSACSIGPVLPYLPLLEDLSIACSDDITFPPLHFLNSVCCKHCQCVKGLHNLPSLTRLDVVWSDLDAEDIWPASLREVSIFYHDQLVPQLIDRIAALQQPTEIATDWSFAKPYNQTLFLLFPDPDQLSFLQAFTTLQRFTVAFVFPTHIVYEYLPSMMSIRELTLRHVSATAQDMQCLAQLASLQHLSLTEIDRPAFSHVSRIPNLTSLHVSSCANVDDYSSLGSCSKLRELFIRDTGHTMPLAEFQALTRLEHIVSLKLIFYHIDASALSHLSAMRGLRELCVWSSNGRITYSSFASLPSLYLLEDICVYPILAENISDLVDCLVQMTRLRCICVGRTLTTHQEARLRDALPRLESVNSVNFDL